jgi:hypothetical protein
LIEAKNKKPPRGIAAAQVEIRTGALGTGAASIGI